MFALTQQLAGFYKGVIDIEIVYFFRCVLKHHINIF
jgi:hypothetical protein